MSQFSNTFNVPQPDIIQSFSGGGTAPFGNPIGYEPHVERPVVIPAGTQPTYVLKIDVTPVRQPPHSGDGPVKYKVTGPATTAAGEGRATVPVTDETVVSHTLPFVDHISQQASEPKEIVHIEPELEVPNVMPRAVMSVYPEDRYAGGMQAGDVIHEGRKFQAEALLQAEGASLATSAPVGIPGGTAASSAHGYSRSLTYPMPEFEEEEQKKHYSWISPAGDAVTVQETEKAALEKAEDDKEKRRRERRESRAWIEKQKRLPWLVRLCALCRKKDPERAEAERWSVAEASLMDEGLMGPGAAENEKPETLEEEAEQVVKPSVIYGGVETEAPKYCGQLPAKSWKLHAVEVHQYIPIPGVKDPLFMSMGLDPEADPLHGAIPLPFDPEKSGMMALTIQDVMQGRVAPRLRPAMAQLFNQELPAMFAETKEGDRYGRVITQSEPATVQMPSGVTPQNIALPA